ncbi:ATP-binding protein [Peptostreptococcus stomatis]|uniref:DNA polymerase III subunit n=1 Tax=Peptostreptococcus stomatis TaxID=341694 RepID=UPI0028D5E984|nr:AAA family ATPase [Peptostreptococcus stomatis]
MFERILGQASVKAKLGRALEMRNITNAYLLTGPEGVGKRMIAEDFAENLLGVRLENSPDYKCIGVKKGENSIKIDQIRDMIGDMSIKPYGNYKIFVIDDADKMTVQAQNALLKTLEEPSAYGIIILVTRNDQALLDTIRSRCLEIKFAPLSSRDIRTILSERGIDDDQAQVASIFSRGSVSRALDICESQDLKLMRQDLESYLEIIFIDKNKYELARMGENFKAYAKDYTNLIDLFRYYIRDIVLLKEGIDPGLIINYDRLDLLRRLARELSISKLGQVMDILDESQTKLVANCHFATTIEAMALNIYEVIN